MKGGKINWTAKVITMASAKIQEKKVGDFSYFGGFHILNTVLIC